MYCQLYDLPAEAPNNKKRPRARPSTTLLVERKFVNGKARSLRRSAQGRKNGGGASGGAEPAAHVYRGLAALHAIDHGGLDAAGFRSETEMGEHHRTGEDGTHGIGNVLVCE